jgi:hypothetical protein
MLSICHSFSSFCGGGGGRKKSRRGGRKRGKERNVRNACYGPFRGLLAPLTERERAVCYRQLSWASGLIGLVCRHIFLRVIVSLSVR